ncbi:MAG: hypothetical protein IKC74_05990, partial [Clostridia bacterium]|nr:hypothetical protein [Clostridia bacterium]
MNINALTFKKPTGHQLFFASVLNLYVYFNCLAFPIAFALDRLTYRDILDVLTTETIFVSILAIVYFVIFLTNGTDDVYAELNDDYLIIDETNIALEDITSIHIDTHHFETARYGRGHPFGKAFMHIYLDTDKYPKFALDGCIVLDGVSFNFCHRLRRRCK